MSLSPEDTIIYTTRLRQAEQAYHDIRMGIVARVYVDQNGERVEFAATSADRLRSYVLELKVALGLPTGIIGPASVWVL